MDVFENDTHMAIFLCSNHILKENHVFPVVVVKLIFDPPQKKLL